MLSAAARTPARPAQPMRPTAAAAQAAVRPTTKPLLTSTVRPTTTQRPATTVSRPAATKPTVTTRPATSVVRPSATTGAKPATGPFVNRSPLQTGSSLRPGTGGTSVGGGGQFVAGPGGAQPSKPLSVPRDANGNVAWKQDPVLGAYVVGSDGQKYRPGAGGIGLVPIASAATSATKPTVTTKPGTTIKPTTTTKPVTSTVTKPGTTTTKPVTSTVTNPARPSSSVGKTVLGAALGVGANALFNKLGQNVANKVVSPTGTTRQPSTTLPRPTTSVTRPAGTTTGTKPTGGTRPGTATKPTTPVTSTVKPAEDQTTSDVVKNEDGTYTMTRPDGSTVTYDNSGNILAETAATSEDTVVAGRGEDTVTGGEDQGLRYMEDGAGNIYAVDAAGNVYNSDGTMIYNGETNEYVDTSGGGEDQYAGTDNQYTGTDSNDQTLYEDQLVSQEDYSDTYDGVDESQDQINVASSDESEDDFEAKNGGFIDLLYKKGGGVHMAAGGRTDLEDGSYYIDNGDGTFDQYDANDEFVGTFGSSRQEMQDGSFMEDNGDGTMSYYDADGNWLYTADANGNITAAGNPNDGTTVIYNPDGSSSTIDQSGNVIATTPYGGVGGTSNPNLVGSQPGQNNTGVLNAIKGAMGDGGVGAAAIGALLGNMMAQGDSPTAVNEGVDMAQLAALQEGSGGTGISVGGGQPGGSYYVPYEQYAYWNQPPEDQLYSDLGVSGYAPQPEGYYAEQRGGRRGLGGYDQALDDSGMYQPQDQVSEMPMTQMPDGSTATFAGGGSTHFTYGKPVSPEENLGFKKGGLSQVHTMHSHHTNPVVQGRIDFRQGSAVNGAGDGQSDDIPAMLADGEYVIDADTVAQLGNGSNKAGAKILDKFREEIRAHKRSAPVNKIPPKSKSALAYLKEAMNG